MSNNTPVNFKASVSEQVKYLLHSQLSKGPDKKKNDKITRTTNRKYQQVGFR